MSCRYSIDPSLRLLRRRLSIPSLWDTFRLTWYLRLDLISFLSRLTPRYLTFFTHWLSSPRNQVDEVAGYDFVVKSTAALFPILITSSSLGVQPDKSLDIWPGVQAACCLWSHGLRPKNFQLVWQCHQLLSGFLAKGHLPRVSSQSRRSLMIRVIMNYPGAVHRSPGICLTAEENPRKPQLGNRVMKGLCDQSLLQVRSVGSHSTLGREKEGTSPKSLYILITTISRNFKWTFPIFQEMSGSLILTTDLSDSF